MISGAILLKKNLYQIDFALIGKEEGTGLKVDSNANLNQFPQIGQFSN